MKQFIKKENVLSKELAEERAGCRIPKDGLFFEKDGTIYRLKQFRHGYHIEYPYCNTVAHKQALREGNVLEELRTATTSDAGCIVVNGINFSNGYGDGPNKVIVRLVKNVWEYAFSAELNGQKTLCSPSELKVNWYDCSDEAFVLKNASFLLPHPRCILIKTTDKVGFEVLKKEQEGKK